MNKSNLVLAGSALVLLCVVVLNLGADKDAPPPTEYKTVFVPSFMAAESGGASDTSPDGVRLARDVQQQITKLAAEGFEVAEVFTVDKGAYRWQTGTPKDTTTAASAWGYGYGYSFTSGVTIIARKVAAAAP